MFDSFVEYLATVYDAIFDAIYDALPRPLTADSLHPTSNAIIAYSTTTSNSFSTSSSSTATNINNHNSSIDYRLFYPTSHTRRPLLFPTAYTPTTPTSRRLPWTLELSPPKNEPQPSVLAELNWLTNRCFAGGNPLERSGPRDNLLLLAEEKELNAQRALKAAERQQQEDQKTHQKVHQIREIYNEVSEYSNNNSTSPSTSYRPFQQQRIATMAVASPPESFIADATYAPFVNTSSFSLLEGEQSVHQLPARNARLAGQSAAEWAGPTKQRFAGLKRSFSDYLEEQEDDDTRTTWHQPSHHCYKKMKDRVQKKPRKNVECMDDIYNTFASWIQAEKNVFATAAYLKRLVYEYPLEHLINVIKWIITDWGLQSIATLLKHIISDWDFEDSHINVARVLREVTEGWEQMEYVSSLVADVMTYRDEPDDIKTAFLKSLCENWDFSRLSAFLMRLDNVDHKIKCELLQTAVQGKSNSNSNISNSNNNK